MSPVAREGPYQVYLDAIRRHVCSVCLDQRDDGSCRLPGARVCAIEGHLPRLVEVLASVQSRRVEDYEQAIRSQLCTTCEGEDRSGHCAYRQSGECALWTYLPLVVDAVEEVCAAGGAPSEVYTRP